MKKTMSVVLAVALAIPLTFAMAFAGNGLDVNGRHYNLNLLGKVNCPGDDLKDTGRHTIMVKLNFSDPDPNNIVGDAVCPPPEGVEDPACLATFDRTNKIFLAPAPPGVFEVKDGNACDGDGAKFLLPVNSDPGPDGVYGTADDIIYGAAYEIWLRELGKPGGSGDLRTCGIDEGPDGLRDTNDDEIVCSSENVLLVRYSGKTSPTGTGKSTFRDVTKELTSMVIQIDVDGDGELETIRIPIFDPTLYQYFWDYDNNGLRLVQLRFYPVQ